MISQKWRLVVSAAGRSLNRAGKNLAFRERIYFAGSIDPTNEKASALLVTFPRSTEMRPSGHSSTDSKRDTNLQKVWHFGVQLLTLTGKGLSHLD